MRTRDLLDDLAARLGYRIRRGKDRPELVQRDGKVAETWRRDYPYEESSASRVATRPARAARSGASPRT
jgi:hypothetical protein